MVSLNNIRGQSNAIRYLSVVLSSERRANSFLFFGPQGVGRALTARAFIAALLCTAKKDPGKACGECPSCVKMEALSHPDVIWIKPEKNKKIKIDEIRNVKDRLNLKPYEAVSNVCVIEDAHMMTVEAENALLKVLEEPPGKSIIILITDKKEILLETVVSRCTEVRFGPLSVDEAQEIIVQNAEVAGDTAYFLASFSQGSPGRAIEMLEEGLIDRKDGILSMAESIAKEQNPSCMNWDEESKDGLIEDLELLVMFFRDITLAKEELDEMVLDKKLIDADMCRFFKAYPVDKIHNIVSELIRFKEALNGNVNPKLVAQALPGILK